MAFSIYSFYEEKWLPNITASLNGFIWYVKATSIGFVRAVPNGKVEIKLS